MPANRSRLIFIVDDDPMHNQMLYDHLDKSFTATIKSFTTGEECVLNLHQKPDVVVLDYHLDGEVKGAADGLEILKQIKAEDDSIDVIMLSGQENIEVAFNIMQNGAFDYVIKNESAFLRTQNIIHNILHKVNQRERLKKYVTSTFAFGGISALLVVVIAVYYLVYLMESGF